MKLCGHEVGLQVLEVQVLGVLGAVLQKDAGFEENMKHNIKCEWKTRREALSIWRDKKITIIIIV